MSTNEERSECAKPLAIVRREPASVTVVFRLTPEEKSRLHSFAALHDCSTSDVIYTALRMVGAMKPAQ